MVFTAAVILFNHVLCFKREKSLLVGHLEKSLLKIQEILLDSATTDVEAVMGLLLCECRIFYQNKALCELFTTKHEKSLKEAHQKLELRVKDIKVRQAIDDVFMMLFD